MNTPEVALKSLLLQYCFSLAGDWILMDAINVNLCMQNIWYGTINPFQTYETRFPSGWVLDILQNMLANERFKKVISTYLDSDSTVKQFVRYL